MISWFKRSDPTNHMFTCSSVQLFSTAVPGTVTEGICPGQTGWVKCQGSFWKAKLYQTTGEITLEPNQNVRAVGREGNTLLVVAEP
ncbi:MAG: hypothetical protein Fur0025_30310 [Oscillatoriaceae cyanobacterium]